MEMLETRHALQQLCRSARGMSKDIEVPQTQGGECRASARWDEWNSVAEGGWHIWPNRSFKAKTQVLRIVCTKLQSASEKPCRVLLYTGKLQILQCAAR